MAWRDDLMPASFRNARFFVEANSTSGGRRGVTFEFPKRDTPLDEDMGRRATRRTVTGYTIGPEYHYDADDLEAALKTQGPGRLVLPILAGMQMRCENYVRSEAKDRGGMAVFEMAFVEAASPGAAQTTEDTASVVQARAATAEDAIDLSAGKDSDWL